MDVLIDTDPDMGTLGSEPEDSLAVTMALVSPEVTVRAITCVQGNVPVRHSYANATYLLELLGRTDVPLAAGEERPLHGATGVDIIGFEALFTERVLAQL